MARVTTLPAMLRPMMGKPSVKTPFCAVCGRPAPLNEHHVVRRGAGRMYDEDGRELQKPTITLCGFGNVLKDADGRTYCHGLAHAGRLHFRWAEGGGRACGGRWEYLATEEPCSYLDALEKKGWKRI
ncbi:hypothetical protein GMI70_06990 [Eggerthellaceae bacterium zg-893]|nr:hypothetical protein [Eggerthellaceae bacterium zg-893]